MHRSKEKKYKEKYSDTTKSVEKPLYVDITELDKITYKQIDQLHNATSNFSTASIEIKKLYFVLIGITVPVLIGLAGNKLDKSLFIALYLISFLFWVIDSFTYYYQTKLRVIICLLFKEIASRHECTNKIALYKFNSGAVIDTSRTQYSLLKAVFNQSHVIYILAIILVILTHVLHVCTVI